MYVSAITCLPGRPVSVWRSPLDRLSPPERCAPCPCRPRTTARGSPRRARGPVRRPSAGRWCGTRGPCAGRWGAQPGRRSRPATCPGSAAGSRRTSACRESRCPVLTDDDVSVCFFSFDGVDLSGGREQTDKLDKKSERRGAARRAVPDKAPRQAGRGTTGTWMTLRCSGTVLPLCDCGSGAVHVRCNRSYKRDRGTGRENRKNRGGSVGSKLHEMADSSQSAKEAKEATNNRTRRLERRSPLVAGQPKPRAKASLPSMSNALDCEVRKDSSCTPMPAWR